MNFKIPEIPQTDSEYYECFKAFSKAINDKNEELINSLIRKEGILQKKFTYDNVTLLHVVAQRGTVQTAIQLCKLGSGVNVQNRIGETPIFHAIKNSTEIVKILINNGADVNITSKRGVSPLHEALLSGSEQSVGFIVNKALLKIRDNSAQDTISSDNLPDKFQNSKELIKILLSHKTDLKLTAKDYPLLILFAAKIGDVDILKLVLNDCRHYLDTSAEKDKEEAKNKPRHSFYYRKERYVACPPEELNYQGYFDRTALHYAVREQLPEVVRFLLKEGADVNCRTRDNYTPLHYASCLENEEICKILLCLGAEVNPNSSRKGNPLFLVCGRSEAKNLLTSGDGYFYEEFHNTFRNRMDSFYEAPATFNPKIMNFLLKNGADPDTLGDEKMTPLLEACRAGRVEEMKILLEFGANIQAVDEQEISALHYAAYGNSFEIVDLLLEKSFDINIRDINGYTPFMTAVQNERVNSVEIIEYLADCGADVNATNCRGATALHIAVHFNWAEITECLLELGADWRLQCRADPSPAVGHILSTFRVLGFQTGRKVLISYIALKDTELGDYINCYVQDGSRVLQEAFDYFNQSKDELKKMKSMNIWEHSRISYYDFLTRDFYNTVKIIKNQEIRKVFCFSKYKAEFPCYSYLLENRFERVEALENSVDKVVDFMTTNEKFKLPILVVDKILNHLRSIDFRVFGKILSRKRC